MGYPFDILKKCCKIVFTGKEIIYKILSEKIIKYI